MRQDGRRHPAGGRAMTPDDAYRDLAQRVRQTARAQLTEIRRARLARRSDSDGDLMLDEAPEGVAHKRRRKAGRRAGLDRLVQDARLQIDMRAGRVELWDTVVQPSRVPADCPVLIDTCPPEMWHSATLPGKPLVFFGPPSPVSMTGDLPRPEAFFGPPWDKAAQEWIARAGDMPEMFGPFLPQPALDDSMAPTQTALNLSAEMRVLPQATAKSDSARVPEPELHEPQATMTPDNPPGPPGPSDLTALPGAGPGLIWMLQKCGIGSLQDLAGADAAVLVPRLGLVGQIVNLQGWQQFARRQTGA